MSIYTKLSYIQKNLKAEKTQYNAFGKYYYRSLEDICNALKEHLEDQKVALTVDDTIEVIEGKFYRKTIATLHDSESEAKVSATMFTQENFESKGMSPEQRSGSTASYSAKYCLNKLFCIDDVKDADATNKHDGNSASQPQKAHTPQKTATKAKYIMPFGSSKGLHFDKIDVKDLHSAIEWCTSKNEEGKFDKLIAEIKEYLDK